MELRFFPLLLVLGMTGYAGETRPAKPNIIIMMADDMGLGDTSAYLDVRLSPDSKPITKTLRTPNLEKFAGKGVIFTDAHAPSSMCSATRYSLLTGRLRTGLI
jgi:arylsulfatase A